ncbi:hypothetical protein [Streptomyces sp. V1I1]|uniref:hypothetical protein n=1 Tax=Streptomyces sp. V1I1 TaxID=3042272 RepID=UPI00278464BF|nr:hypothetical protein [Streptomyces sp. V1I1]MDQ0945955.1 hypothetical protein [Streptomyces sp. V1I1]
MVRSARRRRRRPPFGGDGRQRCAVSSVMNPQTPVNYLRFGAGGHAVETGQFVTISPRPRPSGSTACAVDLVDPEAPVGQTRGIRYQIDDSVAESYLEP